MEEEEYVVVDADYLRAMATCQGRIEAVLERILEKLDQLQNK